MAVLSFESEEDVEALAKQYSVVDGLEIGFWSLRRAYAGSERKPAEWTPRKR